MVFANRCRGFVQKVFAGVGYRGMGFLHLPFGFVPVFAELDFAAHAPLVLRQALFVFFEAIERLHERAITQGGKAGNPHVDANGRCGGWHRLGHFAFGLDAGMPFAA